VDVEASDRKETQMIQKSIFALAAVAALGTAALTPTAAQATWYGYGYGKPYWSYNYYPYKGFYGPRYFYGGYGPRYFYGGFKYRGWRYGYRY
jgi:hypothetical protein